MASEPFVFVMAPEQPQPEDVNVSTETKSPSSTEPAKQRPVFLYGNLMLPNLLARLLFRDETKTEDIKRRRFAGTLYGYKRRLVRGTDFPAIIPSDNQTDTVHGYLFYPESDKERRLLDAFEIESYVREEVKIVSVVTEDTGEVVQAQCFVWDGHLEDLCGTDWDFERFERNYGRICPC